MTSQPPTLSECPIAIIGMACRLPGAESLDEYWDLISSQRSGWTELPPSRFDANLYFDSEEGVHGKSYTRLGGFVPDCPFDQQQYQLDEATLRGTDIAHLNMLEAAGSTFDHAGIDWKQVAGQRAGIYIGHSRGSTRGQDSAYALHSKESIQKILAMENTPLTDSQKEHLSKNLYQKIRSQYKQEFKNSSNFSTSCGASLLAETFQLNGPAMVVDAACASSLVALNMAVRSLLQNDLEFALVGGISLSSWTSLVMFSQARAVSANGSSPFDAGADGFISSDGYAGVLLKRLPDALKNNDNILGVIRGIGMATDGRGKSLWAPRKEGQIQAIQRAWGMELDPNQLQLIEAHGTSTPVGDATELQSLKTVFGERLSSETKIPISSVKANIGHTRETAGLAGVIKVLLAMQNETIPPATNFVTPNPDIPWSEIPFFVPTKSSEWRKQSDAPRRAAVDAFGIGGLNMHVVIDDGVADDDMISNQSTSTSVVSTIGKETVGLKKNGAEAEIERDKPEPIAIVGMGAIFPEADNITKLAQLFLSNKDAKTNVPKERWDTALHTSLEGENDLKTDSLLGGFIREFVYDWRKNKIPPKQVEFADPLQFMILDAAEQALEDANWKRDSFKTENCAVMVGTEFQSDFGIQLTTELRMPQLRESIRESLLDEGCTQTEAQELAAAIEANFRDQFQAMLDETGSYTSSTLASRVTKTFNLMGGAFSLDAGGNSAMSVLQLAIEQLRAGACQSVLCAGAQRSMDICLYQQYADQNLLQHSGSQQAGITPGEGVGTVLLKRLSDAERDGDTIHAVIHDIEIDSDRAKDIAKRTLQNSQITPEQVTSIQPSTLGVDLIDAPVLENLQAAYPLLNSNRLNPNSETSTTLETSPFEQLGYASGAAGMVVLLQSILTQRDRFVEQQQSNKTAKSALTGIHLPSLNRQASHCLLEIRSVMKESKSTTSIEPSPHEIVRVGATSAAAMQEKLQSEIPVASLCCRQFQEADAVRLAMVVQDKKTAQEQLPLAQKMIGDRAFQNALENKGIYLSGLSESSSKPSRVAFLFSGQGSQYAGMLRSWVESDLSIQHELDSINADLNEQNLPSFEQLVWEQGDQLGKDLFQTQLSVLLADLLLYRAVTAMGVTPDVVSAHSFGEYPALVATGAWSLADAIRTTQARCKAIESLGSDLGIMMATSAPREQVEQLIQELDLSTSVFVANHNAEDQVVLSGRHDAINILKEQLKLKEFQATILPVPGPFHSPLMEPACQHLHDVLATIPIVPPKVPLLSSVTNRYTSEPDEIKKNLTQQLIAPVEYIAQINRLCQEGVNLFLEIGPKDVLTKLTRKITGEQNRFVFAVDSPKRTASEQRLRLQAFLEVHRVPFGMMASQEKTSSRQAQLQQVSLNQITHFDATEVRREKNRNAPMQTKVGNAESAISNTEITAETSEELNSFLVTFVCEQTGYPPELVDMDADLEADLGIDSIKKAQLLGELREHFPIEPTADLTLDDFPTLRHIAAFIRDSGGEIPAEAGRVLEPASISVSQKSTAEKNQESLRSEVDRSVYQEAYEAINIHKFSGSPFEIGEQHGRAQEAPIRKTMLRYLDLLGADAFSNSQLEPAVKQAELFFGTDGLEELRGMASAVDLPLQNFILFNFGLVLPVMQLLPGCTQFAIPAKANSGAGFIHGVNEDWNMGRVLQGAFTRVGQVRFQTGTIPCLTFGACGQLGGMNGINQEGLAISSTLLLDHMPIEAFQPGLVHFAIVLKVLQSCKTIEEAVDVIKSVKRNSAWSMCISDHKTDRACYLEYDLKEVKTRTVDGFYGSTNHCLLNESVRDAEDQSLQRHRRLCGLLAASDSNEITLESAQTALRDQFDERFDRVTAHPTKWTIRQPDTQASIIYRPTQDEIYVTADIARPHDADRFHKLSLKELFASKQEEAVDVNDNSHAEDDSFELTQNDLPHPDRLMRRFVLRTVNVPLQKKLGCPLKSPVLILGDNAIARSLEKELTMQGVSSHIITHLQSSESAVNELESLWKTSPSSNLILATGCDMKSHTFDNFSTIETRIEQGCLVPFFVCQRWTQLLQQSGFDLKGMLTAITAFGGDFGLQGEPAQAEAGGLSGLLNAITQEFEHLAVKTIDIAPSDPLPLVSRNLLEEIQSGDVEKEVGYLRGTRRLLRPVPNPILKRQKKNRISKEGTWIVTGGGRGITFQIARALAEKYGVSLRLIGSSPLPEIPDAWRTLTDQQKKDLKKETAKQALQERKKPVAEWAKIEKAIELDANLRDLKEKGIDAVYHSCDLANKQQLESVLNQIRSEEDTISGIVHGAGVEAACRFGKKKPEMVRKTIHTKVTGALHLMQLTQDDPVQFFVGFGSVSGRFGSPGQTDYSLASNLLAKMLGQYRAANPKCQTMTFHWPAWDEVGMAVRPESKLALEVAGIQFMPVAEGIDFLFDELQANLPESEVVLINWPSKKTTKESVYRPAEIASLWKQAKAIEQLPLLDGIASLQSASHSLETTEYELTFDPVHDPFLAQHHIAKVPVLPGVLGMESLWEAAIAHRYGEEKPCEIKNFQIHHGWRFTPSNSKRNDSESSNPEQGRVSVQQGDSNSLLCSLTADFRNQQQVITEPSRRYCSGEIVFEESPSCFETKPIPQDAKWFDMVHDSEQTRIDKNMVWHGEIYQGLQRMVIHENTIWGEILATPKQEMQGNRQGEWALPSAILDCCFVNSSSHLYILKNFFLLPMGVERFVFHKSPLPGEVCLVQSNITHETEKEVLIDFQLVNAQGEPLMTALQFRSAIVGVRKGYDQ